MKPVPDEIGGGLFLLKKEFSLGWWANLFSAFGASRRVPGVQVLDPGTGRLTTRSVTPETALQLSAVFACVRLLAETIAGLPLNFYEVTSSGTLKQIREHDLYWLLATKPNRYQTHVEFFETMVFQMAMHGNSYNKIDRNSKGGIISLLPLMTLQVQAILEESGTVNYQYNNGRSVIKIPQEGMWHNKLFGNGIVGMSPLDFARNSIGIAISGEDRVNKMANSGFKQAGVLMIDKILNPDQRKQVRANFSDLASGGEDSLMVLEAGAKYQATAMNPRDVQLLETRRFQTEDIARFFGVPSVLINDTSATTVWGSGIEQIITGFYKLGLRPYLERIEASIVNWLLLIDERRKIVPAFDFDMLLRGDEKTRYETYRSAISSGVRTVNECRKMEGLSPVDGGDVTMMQTSLAPLGSLKNGGKKNDQSQTAGAQPGRVSKDQ